MANIFNRKDEFVEKPKRNNFDLSFVNHLTLKFGQLVPVFCKPVYPGDSFNIDADFGFQFMPMAFPVQSRMRAHLHFFYVRNRNLWEDWPDYIGHTKDGLIHPYIKNTDPDFYKCGSLSDYLGVPTSVVGSYGSAQNLAFTRVINWSDFSRTELNLSLTDPNFWRVRHLPSFIFGRWCPPSDPSTTNFLSCLNSDLLNCTLDNLIWSESNLPNPVDSYGTGYLTDPFSNLLSADPDSHRLKVFFPCFGQSLSAMTNISLAICSPSPFALNGPRSSDPDFFSSLPISEWRVSGVLDRLTITYDSSDGTLGFELTDAQVDFINSSILANGWCRLVVFTGDKVFDTDTFEGTAYLGNALFFSHFSQVATDLSEASDSFNPFVQNEIKLSALPYRAYESIYNAFYRNQQNDPFILNGVPEYNKYISTNEGGPDGTPYHLFYRNWELDFLTSALPSPQQGIAPLVGMTAAGDITITDENGITTGHCTVDQDENITKIVLTSPAASVQHARTAMNIAAAGMSINDFRSANALQRFLEKNIRRGYKYKDQIMSHFGVEPSYAELDMPEFIGGVSQDVSVHKITQTVDQGEFSPLGAFSGDAVCMGSVGHSVTHYCDEHGFIMGILCVVPTPSYSQLLPKFFLNTNNALDYYSPEFGSIGMQPITYQEVAPIQSYIEQIAGHGNVKDTFGYQRPWYDLIASVDEVHSSFRLDLRDFLINRVFNVRPELGYQFLHIDPDQVNDVFVDRTDNDKIIGQVRFKCFAKRPIPRSGIARLE